jgi:hypothetical protein
VEFKEHQEFIKSRPIAKIGGLFKQKLNEPISATNKALNKVRDYKQDLQAIFDDFDKAKNHVKHVRMLE